MEGMDNLVECELLGEAEVFGENLSLSIYSTADPT
jgi:hypothetical protein